MGVDPHTRAICIVLLGGPAADRKLRSETRLEQTARHEAAHAVLGYFLLSRSATSISIVPDQERRTYGVTRFTEVDTPCESPILAEVASRDDDTKAQALLVISDPSATHERWAARFAVLEGEAEVHVLHYRDFIEALAQRLLAALAMTGEQIREVIEGVRIQKHLARMRELETVSATKM